MGRMVATIALLLFLNNLQIYFNVCGLINFFFTNFAELPIS